MKWRLLKLDMNYAVGELVIVTAGVLIALFVGEWNNGRLAEIEEINIIERLLTDISDDAGEIELGKDIVSRKIPALQRLRSYALNPESITGRELDLINDLPLAANYGWNQNNTRPTTYNELLTSGRFNLIRDAELRSEIAEYYDSLQSTENRIDERETRFPNLVLSLLPGGRNSISDLNDVDAALVISDFKSLNVRLDVQEELSFAEFVQDRLTYMGEWNQEMASSLNDYLNRIKAD